MTVDPAKVPAGTQLSGALVGSIDGSPSPAPRSARSPRRSATTSRSRRPTSRASPRSPYALLWDADEPVRRADRRRRRDHAAPHEGQLRGDVVPGARPHARHDRDRARRRPEDRRSTENASVALDARTAKQITLDVGDEGPRRGLPPRWTSPPTDFAAAPSCRCWTDEMWAQPMKVDDADFDFTTRWRLMKPMLTVAARQEAARHHPPDRLDLPRRRAQGHGGRTPARAARTSSPRSTSRARSPS